jgi:ferrous iron transport protein B
MTVWRKLLKGFRSCGLGKRDGGCHGAGLATEGKGSGKIGIIGSPNVGKSVVFTNLTRRYVTVSNYPGTTVTVSRGKARIEEEEFEVIDTPGMYSLLPITEEERVARSILLEERPELILHVVDAKNLERLLPLTLQFIESGLPIMLELNMMDETEAAGIEIDVKRLEDELRIPVVPTVAISGWGMGDLRKRIVEYVRSQRCAARV